MSPLTKEEALRQIAELQRHVESLEKKKNNHPDKIEEGMLFEHCDHGLCIVHTDDTDTKFMLVFLDGQCWAEYDGFADRGDEFKFLGESKDLLMLKPSVTTELASAVHREYGSFPGPEIESMGHALKQLFKGKLRS